MVFPTPEKSLSEDDNNRSWLSYILSHGPAHEGGQAGRRPRAHRPLFCSCPEPRICLDRWRGEEKTSDKASGRAGGEVKFAWDEEIIAISGIVGISRGFYAGYTIISSLTFITNKRTHGPYEKTFNVPWDKGSFARFYGCAGAFIDAIDVYLKTTV
uniref:Jacalin-type lectin domain-containing protein n=1 Tax=Lactuca sativa TaxID=4236 RepID=A0A9R1WDE7_LACSA|nr:hypothetical protein LSAT_V11C200054070 [Lactuca sativa]